MPHKQFPAPPEEPRTRIESNAVAVDEAIARYDGQWVLMKVTERDADQLPVKGHVLAHSTNRDEISAVLAKEPPPSAFLPDAPHRPYYTFRAYPRIRSGPEYDEAMRRFLADFAAARAERGARKRP